MPVGFWPWPRVYGTTRGLPQAPLYAYTESGKDRVAAFSYRLLPCPPLCSDDLLAKRRPAHAQHRIAGSSTLGHSASSDPPAGVVTHETDTEGYVKGPLDWAPRAASYCRRLFDDETIAAHVAALGGRQQADGGWPILWPPLSPVCEIEWRGSVTVEALLTLRSYGVLSAS
jgi:hypothetical protein